MKDGKPVGGERSFFRRKFGQNTPWVAAVPAFLMLDFAVHVAVFRAMERLADTKRPATFFVTDIAWLAGFMLEPVGLICAIVAFMLLLVGIDRASADTKISALLLIPGLACMVALLWG